MDSFGRTADVGERRFTGVPHVAQMILFHEWIEQPSRTWNCREVLQVLLREPIHYNVEGHEIAISIRKSDKFLSDT